MKNYFALFSLLSVLIFTACKKESFNLNAEYKDTPVVFGLLDQSQTRQYIKINRTFLGEGNSFDDALVRDSSEYADADLTGKVVEIVAGTETNSWDLIPARLPRDPNSAGDMYLDSVKVYYFDNANWNNNATYRLEFTAKGIPYSAETQIVSNTNTFKNPSVIGATNILPSMKDQLGFRDLVMSMDQPIENAGRYEYYWTFKYDEYKGSLITPKTIRFKAGETITSNGIAPYNSVSYQSFLNYIAANIAFDPAVTKRAFKGVNAEIIAGSEELDIYMSLTDPNLASLNDRPVYGNVSNEAIGLFSSRVYYKTYANNSTTEDRDYYFDSSNGIQEFLNGTITGNLLFCFDSLHVEEKLGLNQNKSFYLNETCN